MIKLSLGFSITSTDPIDKRFLMTKAEMLDVNDNLMPDKYFTLCSDDGKLYLYDKLREEFSPVTGKFISLDVAVDNKSIIYLSDDGLSIKGYANAKHGLMLVKDSTQGIVWTDPVSTEELESLVALSRIYKDEATLLANRATTQADEAAQSAAAANRINQYTMNYINNKFWWGTQAEYNALKQITEGTYYFILD